MTMDAELINVMPAEFDMLKKQAMAGDIDSQCHVACAYAFGEGVEQDRDQAIE